MIDSFFRLRRFVTRIAQRFIEENFDQISASLAFTTLLSLVPLVALMLSLIAVAPFFRDLSSGLICMLCVTCSRQGVPG